MLSVNTNVAANLAKMHSDYAESKQQVSMAHLSSGSRVNSAADDAAGMAVSSKMKSQIKGLGSVLKNISDGMSLSQLADSSSQQITDIVIRLRELAIQNHNGVYTDQDRQNAEQEKIALIQVNRFQSYGGSIQNRLGSSLELTYLTLENASKARGRVIDADFAAETQTMATQQILMQSAQSVLAQANSAKQNILSLIG